MKLNYYTRPKKEFHKFFFKKTWIVQFVVLLKLKNAQHVVLWLIVALIVKEKIGPSINFRVNPGK